VRLFAELFSFTFLVFFAFHVFSVFILKFSNLFWMERHRAGLILSKKREGKKKRKRGTGGSVKINK
jgi:hypothetical protein